MTSTSEYIIRAALVLILLGSLLITLYIIFPRYYNGVCWHTRDWLMDRARQIAGVGFLIIILVAIANLIFFMANGEYPP